MLTVSHYGSSGCGNIIVLRPGFDLGSSPSHQPGQPGLIILTIVLGQSYHLTISLSFSFVVGDERHFLVIFGYETAALSSRGEDDLIKVLNATSPLDLSPTLAMFHLPPPAPGVSSV